MNLSSSNNRLTPWVAMSNLKWWNMPHPTPRPTCKPHELTPVYHRTLAGVSQACQQAGYCCEIISSNGKGVLLSDKVGIYPKKDNTNLVGFTVKVQTSLLLPSSFLLPFQFCQSIFVSMLIENCDCIHLLMRL